MSVDAQGFSTRLQDLSEASFEEVLITPELAQRAARKPDYAVENRALTTLCQELSGSPQILLQKLCDTALELCSAQSVGISILEEEDGKAVFRWHALAGWYAPYLNNTAPFDFAPCAMTLERNAPQLFRHLERYDTYLQSAGFPLVEGLLIPFHLEDKPIGTLWVVAHEAGRQFDTEDVRLLSSLTLFAAAARKMMLATRAQSHLAAIVESSRDAILSYSLQGHVLTWNQGAEAVFGYTAEEAKGQHISFVIPPERSHEADEFFSEVRQGRAIPQFESERLRKDGQRIEVSITFSPLTIEGQIIGASALVRDITAHKQAERALHASETQINGILERMTDAMTVLDKEWRIRFMNQAAARLNGKAPEEFLGKTHWEEWPASVGTPVEAAYRHAMSEQVPVHLEHRYQDATRDAWLEISAYPTGDSLGIFYRDISERKRAEEALHHSEERFRAAVLAVGDIVWTNDADGRMVGEQSGWGAFTGQSYEEYQDYGWANAVHPEDAQPTIDAWDKAVAARRMFVFEHRLKRADGVWRLFAIRGVPVLNGDGSIREWVGVHTDITERREIESEIQALNARLRRAMTETHHRVKNNLQIMSALIEMQRYKQQDSVPIAELLRLKQNIQALGVIHEILTAEAKTDGDAAFISGRGVLEQLLPILRVTLGDRRLIATIDEVFLPGKQATSLALITNELISNAVKHGKGDIEIELHADHINAHLEVCDDGPGFAETFDPGTAANTGLELIENIARYDLRGETAYENREKGGARVVIAFPLQRPSSVQSGL